MGLSKSEMCKRMEIIEKYLIKNNDFNKRSFYDDLAFFMSLIPDLEKFYRKSMKANDIDVVEKTYDFISDWITKTNKKCGSFA